MKRLVILAVMAAQVPVPAAAASLDVSPGADRRMGAFLGARLRISLDAQPRERVHAAVGLAPTLQMRGMDGARRSRIGEGLELGVSESGTSGLAFAGQPISRLVKRGGEPEGQRRNVSTAGAIAIGVGVVAASVVALYWLCGSGTICNTDDE